MTGITRSLNELTALRYQPGTWLNQWYYLVRWEAQTKERAEAASATQDAQRATHRPRSPLSGMDARICSETTSQNEGNTQIVSCRPYVWRHSTIKRQSHQERCSLKSSICAPVVGEAHQRLAHLGVFHYVSFEPGSRWHIRRMCGHSEAKVGSHMRSIWACAND